MIKKRQYTTKKHYRKFTTEEYTKILIVIIATLAGFMTLASASYLTLLNSVYILSASSLQLFSTIQGNVPGLLSVFWGLISDIFPIFGYRRKPYMIMSAFLLVLAFIGFANFAPSSASTGLSLMFFASILGALLTVLIRAIVAEITQKKNHTNLLDEKSKQGETSKNICSILLGGYVPAILCTAGGGIILINTSFKVIFYITMVFPLMIFFLLFKFPESKFTLRRRLSSDLSEINENLPRSTDYDSRENGIMYNLSLRWKFFRRPDFFKPAIFLLLVNIFQLPDSIFNKYYTSLGLGTEDFLL